VVNAPAGNPGKTIRLIHFAMFFGALLAAAVMVVVARRPDAPSPSLSPTMGVVLTGVGALSMLISIAALRPRFAARSSSESSDAFWTPPRIAAAMPIWALIEGGALIGVVGYFLTRMWAPLALVPLAMLLGYATRPTALEGN
jgi:hypothetical protein